MKVEITVVKGSKEGKYTAKYATSVGGGQDRIKDVTLQEVTDYAKKLIEDADKSGFVGKK